MLFCALGPSVVSFLVLYRELDAKAEEQCADSKAEEQCADNIEEIDWLCSMVWPMKRCLAQSIPNAFSALPWSPVLGKETMTGWRWGAVEGAWGDQHRYRMGIVMSIQYYDVISKHPCFFLGLFSDIVSEFITYIYIYIYIYIYMYR